MKKPDEPSGSAAKETFVEGLDYYFEDGLMVLTARFLRNRGYCCGNGCRHCPYSDQEREIQSRNSSSSL
ncbi:MAG: DUF5522 domain-containing protein [Acidobacteriota bacterium]